ncbi:MAG TPA: type II CAAX endopeptidase family protein [Candidatus Acidoferrales bacterium]|nr:type II CAAX endopeptidase family protein [Candidatus Acidoferrales bacterium]
MSQSAPAPFSRPPAGAGNLLERMFLGGSGLRSGWRLLVYFTLALLVLVALETIVGLFHRSAAIASSSLDEVPMLLSEVPMALSAFAAAFIMGKFERRSFDAYGLPWRQAFSGRFWEGAIWGFAALSGVVGALAGVHSLSFSAAGLGWTQAVAHGLLWGALFLAVGFFEEFFFRGYALATLAGGIGFWPAAVVLSVVFGAVHLGNAGETVSAASETLLVGLLFCFTLRRTGSLWFGIGLHAAWDWGETFFYGVPDSGQVASHHLLNSAAHGPIWLTGGTAGPEGGAVALMMVAGLCVLASLRFRQVRFPPRAGGGLEGRLPAPSSPR